MRAASQETQPVALPMSSLAEEPDPFAAPTRAASRETQPVALPKRPFAEEPDPFAAPTRAASQETQPVALPRRPLAEEPDPFALPAHPLAQKPRTIPEPPSSPDFKNGFTSPTTLELATRTSPQARPVEPAPVPSRPVPELEPAMAFASNPLTEPSPSTANDPVVTPTPEPSPGSLQPPSHRPLADIPGVPGNLLPISGHGPVPELGEPLSSPPPVPLPAGDAILTSPPGAVAMPAAPPQPNLSSPGPGPEASILPDSPNLIPAPALSGNPVPASVGAGAPSGYPQPDRLRWPGVVFPLLFLLLSGIVIYLVLDLSGIFNTAKVPPPVPLTPETAPNHQARRQALASAGHSGAMGTRPARPSTRLHPISENIPPVERLDLKVDGELPPTPIIDLGVDQHLPVAAAPTPFDPTNPSSVLEKFLTARNLEERLPVLTLSKYSVAELAETSLGRPLPEIVNRRSVHYMEDRNEQRKEHFFEVFFQIDPNERPVPILIQLNDWGDGAIRVHTDAFLDLFEDRLGQFAEAPVAGAQTLHVVADAYKHCFDEIIPEWEKKSFLKLRTHPRMAPRLIAHFSRTSSLADEISAPNALPWGESGICTVTVRWNTEVPERPFVELIRINGFTWNP